MDCLKAIVTLLPGIALDIGVIAVLACVLHGDQLGLFIGSVSRNSKNACSVRPSSRKTSRSPFSRGARRRTCQPSHDAKRPSPRYVSCWIIVPPLLLAFRRPSRRRDDGDGIGASGCRPVRPRALES